MVKKNNFESLNGEILIGSSYFFSQYQDYISHDIDVILFREMPETIKFQCIQQYHPRKDIFVFNKKLSKKDHLDIALNGEGLVLGKFLVPEFCEKIDFTIDDLKKLRPLLKKLKEKHYYESLIFESYLQNNAFKLTEAQRANAYNLYKLARRKDY